MGMRILTDHDPYEDSMILIRNIIFLVAESQ